MGRRSDFPGVEQHGDTLRVTFAYQKERCREPLGWPPTAANWARAAKLRADVLRAIRAGTFQYITFFPNSPKAAKKSHTFASVAQEWINAQELAESTAEGYEIILNTHWMPKLGAKAVADITPGLLKTTVKNAGFKSIKTRNNAVSVLRMVFEYAKGERYLVDNPAEKLEHKEAPDPEPDPFSQDEMWTILDWMKERADAQVYNYFRFAFFSGLRSSELLQLQWPKVDFLGGYVRVDEALVRTKTKDTKTHNRRDVELNDESRAALLDQKSYTYLAGEHVFLNPNTGKPYYNHQSVWRVLVACLKAKGIRHRPAYNTRHTFATLNLMAGANPYWVSTQMGHRSLEMTLKVYSRWIKGGDQKHESNKLMAFLGRTPNSNPTAASTPKPRLRAVGQSVGQKGVIRGIRGDRGNGESTT